MTAFDGPVVPDVRMMKLGSQGSTGRDGSARSDVLQHLNAVQSQFANGCRHVPDDDDVPQLRRLDLLQSRQQAGMRHHHLCIRQLDGMLQQSSAIAGIDRHVHGAEVVRGEPRQDGFGRVRHPAQHVRALLHTEGPQTRPPHAERGPACLRTSRRCRLRTPGSACRAVRPPSVAGDRRRRIRRGPESLNRRPSC